MYANQQVTESHSYNNNELLIHYWYLLNKMLTLNSNSANNFLWVMSFVNVVLEKLACFRNDAHRQFSYHYFDKQMISPLSKRSTSIFKPFGNRELVAHCAEQFWYTGFLFLSSQLWKCLSHGNVFHIQHAVLMCKILS